MLRTLGTSLMCYVKFSSVESYGLVWMHWQGDIQKTSWRTLVSIPESLTCVLAAESKLVELTQSAFSDRFLEYMNGFLFIQCSSDTQFVHECCHVSFFKQKRLPFAVVHHWSWLGQGEQSMEGEHARVKPVAKGHYSPALVSIHLRISYLEKMLDHDPKACGFEVIAGVWTTELCSIIIFSSCENTNNHIGPGFCGQVRDACIFDERLKARQGNCWTCGRVAWSN